MNHTLENETLTIFLEGELNTFSADGVEKEIEALLSQGGFKAIRLDFSDVVYISSAGLRIIVRIKQRYDDTSLIHVSKDVYDVFALVGFQNIIKIERK